jgi:signal transduction histidine kinase
MNGFGALLEQEYASQLDPKGADYIGRIRRGAVTLAQMVDDLLAYARVERIELEQRPTDIATLLANCVAECREEAERAGAEISLRADSVVLDIDPQALMQSARNLLQNAIKFSRTAKPPRIVIECERTTEPDRECIRIRFKDNGIGFDMQYHEQIFALFQRLHRADEYAGTGIGLAIARKAVERMGGRVWGQSSVGNGATFYIELPCSRIRTQAE